MPLGIIATMAFLAVAFEVNPSPGGGIYIDLLNLQWWQAVFGIVGVLGLSPAPWIGGLIAGRIQFTNVARKDFERQLTEKDAAHARELAARDIYHEGLMAQEKQRYADSEAARELNAAAAERERQRAEEATGVLVDMTEVVRSAQHFMRATLEAGEAAVKDA